MEIEIFIEGGTITITGDSNIEIITNRGTNSSLPNIEISKYRYFEIRDLAWQVLIDCNVKELPVMTLNLRRKTKSSIIDICLMKYLKMNVIN